MRRSIPGLWAVLILGLLPLAAFAQGGARKDRVPAIDFGKVVTPPIPEDITGGGASAVDLGQLDNPFLKDTIVLHHQIGLLERLIERQAVISKIESAYASLNLPFHSPPPPREICLQLPASIPCARGYPDLAGASMEDISIDAADLLPDIVLPPEALGKSATVSGQEKETQAVPERYKWTEVSCAGKRCKAVLVQADNPALRRTIVAGDVLDDGSTVSAISFDGVLLSRNGKPVPLEPAKAPSRGGPVSPALGSSGEGPAPAVGLVPPHLFPRTSDAPPTPTPAGEASPTGNSQASGDSPTP